VRQLGQAARRDLAAERGRVGAAATALLPRASRLAGIESERLDARARRLHLVDPRRVVERGYAILRGSDGRVVDDAKGVPRGAKLTAELRSGRLGLIAEGEE
jgi:exodeoxyribonuclease VII large subunit